MVDGVVCGLGTAVAIGVTKIPLSPHGYPEEGDELSCPDCASPVAAVEFEAGVVGFEKIFLEDGPVDD